jgi:hypothetical protein
MKFIVLGLCFSVIPAFGTTSSCSQQYSSLVGCQAMDSLLASISDGSVVTTSQDSFNFAASLLTPAPTIPVVPPASILSSSPSPISLMENTASTPSLSPDSLFGYNPYPQVSVSVPNSTSLANQLVMDQIPLSSLIVPTEFLNLSQGLASDPTSFNFFGTSFNADPSVPETGSIAMIGSGLIFLSILSTVGRWRKRLS